MTNSLLYILLLTYSLFLVTTSQPLPSLLPDFRNGSPGSPKLLNIINNYSYSNPQYYSNSKWNNIDNENIDYNNLYNSLLNYKTNEIRLNNKSNILNFRLAYITLDVTINNTFININWENINFKDNSSLYIDFYYLNKTTPFHPMTNYNIYNRHHLNIHQFIKQFIFFDFYIKVKSNKYNLETYRFIDFNNLIKIYTNNTHFTGPSYCITYYCNKNIKKSSQVCYNDIIYKSACHAVCQINSLLFNELKSCTNISSISKNTIF